MISNDQIAAIGGWLGDFGASANMEQELRAAFPDMHFTFCSDDDVISDNPAASYERFNLYLVDSSQHCLSLTLDPESASGLVVAEVEEQ